MTILVTGSAGFIGSHVAQRLLSRGDEVVGLDVLDDYYSVGLKRARLGRLAHHRFRFVEGDVADEATLARAFEGPIDVVVHLAAQVGVRHSIRRPEAYVHANLVGFSKVIEAARHRGAKHFVYASSSSVYGANTTLPFHESHGTDQPISLYAATKKANEVTAHAYSHLFGLPTSGLRFFTVYGPWGRPDMAYFQFTERLLGGRPIPLFGGGTLRRDFTFVDDVARAVVEVLDRPATTPVPARVLNVGSGTPVEVRRLVTLLEAALGREALVEPHPMQRGDMVDTWADVGGLAELLGWQPRTPLEVGVTRFAKWYSEEYERGVHSVP